MAHYNLLLSLIFERKRYTVKHILLNKNWKHVFARNSLFGDSLKKLY